MRLIDHPPRVLVAGRELRGGELARAGLTAADVYALLREKGIGDLGQVSYLLYETRGAVTVIGADREPGPLTLRFGRMRADRRLGCRSVSVLLKISDRPAVLTGYPPPSGP